ncbi:MAG: phosphoribosylformylglycinamidine synthase subunit PurS [Deltaproteobacteria bacterium]|nr:phosphoribosylformylglycinamidine synthase subunit PurS [Deltaproteobacteria bacterium]
MKANIFVTLKREVLDPQGDAVRRSLLLANPVIEDFHYEILD